MPYNVIHLCYKVMKSKQKLIAVFAAVFAFSWLLSNNPVIPSVVFAENNPDKICKENRFAAGDALKYCKIGFQGGYADQSLDQTCGTDTSPKGDIINAERRGQCAAGWQFGAAEKREDNNGRPPPRPEGQDLESKADAACKSDYSGDTYEACKRGYKAANANGATEDSVRKVCEKEKSQNLKNACFEGIRLSGVNDLANVRDIRPQEADGGNEKEEEKDTPDCDTTLTSILSWIACPLIDMGVGFTDLVFKDFVQPMLENVPVSTEKGDAAFEAWKDFRLLANILLVGSLLAIVYSQAKGGK